MYYLPYTTVNIYLLDLKTTHACRACARTITFALRPLYHTACVPCVIQADAQHGIFFCQNAALFQQKG